MNIQELENNHQLAYKFVRGSTLYNTNIETSDVDYGGVFILPNESLLGLPDFYQDSLIKIIKKSLSNPSSLPTPYFFTILYYLLLQISRLKNINLLFFTVLLFLTLFPVFVGCASLHNVVQSLCI